MAQDRSVIMDVREQHTAGGAAFVPESLACGICGGELVLLHAGTESIPTPGEMAPTNHRPGEHGDLFACRECGTVEQPELLARADLHELYRDMRDDAYLEEERGRRASGRRLLDLIGRHVTGGRLLDAGCGHGLLLDEARGRGFEVLGLEISRHAAAHARSLGLDVLEVPLEDFQLPPEGGFDAIVLADVIEHLGDPQAALDRCVELLRPGGILCVITPDPSSPVARLAGSRWWGFLPAHTYLLPRRTLRELLAARGLVVSAEVPLVRTFSLGYWMSGMAERSGPLGGLAAPLRRLASSERLLSLSLRDEPVMLAQKVELAEPVRGSGSELPAIAASLVEGADVVVLTGRPASNGLAERLTAPIVEGRADAVVASGGGPSLLERLVLALDRAAFGRRLSAPPTGSLAASAELMRSIPFLRARGGPLFEEELSAQFAARGARVTDVALDGQGPPPGPLPLLARAVRTLVVLARMRLDSRREWALLRRPAARLERRTRAPGPAEPGS
jgi:2-polyprenyl-3-methyl-5-hydroxy-6-metoxy-1,4-benzoquinol methylase